MVRQRVTRVGDAPLLWLRRASLLGLTALAAWLAVRLVIAVTTPSSLYAPVSVAMTAPVANAASPAAYDFSYNPFDAGDAEAEIIDAPEPGDDAPETTLNLELKGQRSGANGSAYIRTPNGDEDNFYVGDAVMPGVILRGVFPDYVLIDVNGQTQRLTTEDAKAARAAAQRGSAAPARRGLQTLQVPDASTLLSQVWLSPVEDDAGNRIGVTIRSRNSSVDLSPYGLEAGDVITRFAGQDVARGLPDIAVLRRVATSGAPVSVDLLRGGQPLTITIGSSQ